LVRVTLSAHLPSKGCHYTTIPRKLGESKLLKCGFRASSAACFSITLFCASASGAIINGDFENGDFTGFTRLGFINNSGGPNAGGPAFTTFLAAAQAGTRKTDSNGVISSQTAAFDSFGVPGPAIAPYSGAYLAFITNQDVDGNNTLTGSSITQTFAIPVGVTTLSFAVALLNNDDPPDVVEFNDFGGVALTQGSQILNEYNLDLNPASAANLHVTFGASQGGFVNSTPWVPASFNVAAVAGQNVTLTAYSLNYGADNSTETRLLLDSITLNGPTSVPEPLTFTFTGIGLIMVAGRRAWGGLRRNGRVLVLLVDEI